MRAVSDRNAAVDRLEIDELFERYVSWREGSQAVGLAYQRWADSDRGARRLAYAGYLAALDMEEHAARTLADQIERVRQVST